MKLAYIDLEQAESRVVGAILVRLFGDHTYLDAQESGDAHTLICSMCWTELNWPADFNLETLRKSNEKKFPDDIIAAAKKIANRPLYRNWSYRDGAKRLSHATNYYADEHTLAQTLQLDRQIVRSFKDKYLNKSFRAIPRWHNYVKAEIETNHEIITMLGRRLRVLEDPTASATLRAMIAAEPQSVGTGDYINTGTLTLSQNMFPLYIIQQTHDSITIEYDARDEHWLIPEVERILSWEFPLYPEERIFSSLKKKETLLAIEKKQLADLQQLNENPRQFRIPCASSVGWNLAEYEAEKNPNGLLYVDPRRPDKRIRLKKQDSIMAAAKAAVLQ